MTEKELFKAALRAVDRSYSYEEMLYGDDLYNATEEEKEKAGEYYEDISSEGLNWAYKYLETLN